MVGVNAKVAAGDALGANPWKAPAHTTVNAVVAVTLSLKLTTIGAPTATPVAPLRGVVLVTNGAVSLGEAVLKLKLTLAAMWSGVPSVSVMPLASTLTWQIVPAGSEASGVSVNVEAGDVRLG